MKGNKILNYIITAILGLFALIGGGDTLMEYVEESTPIRIENDRTLEAFPVDSTTVMSAQADEKGIKTYIEPGVPKSELKTYKVFVEYTAEKIMKSNTSAAFYDIEIVDDMYHRYYIHTLRTNVKDGEVTPAVINKIFKSSPFGAGFIATQVSGAIAI